MKKLEEGKKKSKVKKMMIETAIRAKLKNLKKNCKYTHNVWDKLIFNKIR